MSENVTKKMENLNALILFMLCFALLLSGCSLYADFNSPFDTTIDNTDFGPKVGKASAHAVLWLFAWGDMGVAAAAKKGNITRVNHMDRESFQVLYGLYTRQTTVVYGE